MNVCATTSVFDFRGHVRDVMASMMREYRVTVYKYPYAHRRDLRTNQFAKLLVGDQQGYYVVCVSTPSGDVRTIEGVSCYYIDFIQRIFL